MATNEEEEEERPPVDTSVLETKGLYYAHQDQQKSRQLDEQSPEPAVDVLISDDMVIVESEDGDVSILSDTLDNIPVSK